MRLVALEVVRLPGVDEPYRVDGLAAGVTVVTGPNASGKSSLMRALTALWNPNVHSAEHVEVRGEFVERLPDGSYVNWRAERVGKKIVWQRDGANVRPPKPPAAHLLNSYLVSIETLMQTSDTDLGIGDALRREMSGGFDIGAARKSTELSNRGGQKAVAELKNAQRELRELERAQSALFANLQQRGLVEQRWKDAAGLAAQAGLYDRGTELARDIGKLSELRAKLAVLPATLGRMSGDEAEQLADLDRRRASAEAASAQAEKGVLRWRSDLADTGLAEAQVDWATASRLETAANSLREAADDAAETDRQAAQLNAELREPWRRLGGGAGSKVATRAAFDAAHLEAAETALGQRMSAAALMDAERNDIGRLEAEVEALGAATSPHAVLNDAQLRQAQSALEGWLAAEPSPQPARVLFAPAAVLFIAAVLLAVAALMGVGGGSFSSLFDRTASAGPSATVLALGGVVALLVGAVWLLLLALAGRRASAGVAEAATDDQVAQKSYLRTGAEPPFEWTHLEVAHRLQELVSEESQRRVTRARLEVVNDLLRVARQRLGNASGHLRSADLKIRQLAEVTGYRVPAGSAVGPGFAAWLRDAREADFLLGKLQGLHARRQRLEERGQALYAELISGLEGTRFEVTAVVEGVAGWRDGRWRSSKLGEADELCVRAEQLKEAVGQRDRANAELKTAQRELQEANAALADAQLMRAELLQRCQLDPDAPDVAAQLHTLIGQLPAYRQASLSATELEAVVRNAEEALAQVPHILEAAQVGDLAALEEGRRHAEQAEEERDRTGRQLGELSSKAAEAEQGEALERARARADRATQLVADHIRRAQLNAATAFLFDDVEGEHRTRQEPQVLTRARTWFERFTHKAFTLEFEPTAAPQDRLGARAITSGRRLHPTELSTGTRAQLLLALRVAYATCAEDGQPKFPFFLDEALTTADRLRFEQIATSLLELAQQDERQIFYLSSRFEDASAWQKVAEGLHGDTDGLVEVIDLAAARGIRAARP